MKKRTLIGLGLTGITGLGSAITAMVINKRNKRQLDEINIKEEEIKEETKESIKEKNIENNQEDTIKIDDTDIEV